TRPARPVTSRWVAAAVFCVFTKRSIRRARLQRQAAPPDGRASRQRYALSARPTPDEGFPAHSRTGHLHRLPIGIPNRPRAGTPCAEIRRPVATVHGVVRGSARVCPVVAGSVLAYATRTYAQARRDRMGHS